MGFLDRDVKNGFDKMFDLNKDGVLDPGEQAMQYAFVDKISREKYSGEEEDELDQDGLFDEEDEDQCVRWEEYDMCFMTFFSVMKTFPRQDMTACGKICMYFISICNFFEIIIVAYF